MSKSIFTISYGSQYPNVTFANEAGIKKYLKSEAAIWQDFLEKVSKVNATNELSFNNTGFEFGRLSNVFQRLEDAVGDPASFERMTSNYQRSAFLPPPSGWVEGQLILGLYKNERFDDAVSTFVAFLGAGQSVNYGQQWKARFELGRRMLEAAHVAAALPFHKVSSQKMAAEARTAAAHTASLEQEVAGLKKLADISSQLHSKLAKTQTDAATRQSDLFIASLDAQSADHSAQQKALDDAATDAAALAKARHDKISKAALARLKDQKAEFERLQDLFYTQLRLRAPVKLWADLAELHENGAFWAFWRFLGFSVIAIAIATLVPFCFGSYIADSFYENVCTPMDPTKCERMFSVKGPLTLTGLLVVMSIIMWGIRLQYRLYLSERHLGLDANEKKAFAETYMAMREGEQVSAGNEAIVLASLFRPTQDGIIKDDESSMDFSAMAIIAKQMGRST